ncbi:unnamed protein product [Rotaria magnacalcarata]|uniref:B box-type domain-containing protein n=3 Tax=Rotaria magnacalcarata TaxID=392030 RepID=A0A819C5S4_9BILA|nr:unnamed protein product [Rotaria magnacalcarata]
MDSPRSALTTSRNSVQDCLNPICENDYDQPSDFVDENLFNHLSTNSIRMNDSQLKPPMTLRKETQSSINTQRFTDDRDVQEKNELYPFKILLLTVAAYFEILDVNLFLDCVISAVMQQQACTGCKDGVGLCTGCQNLFCPRHFSEHRKELDRRMIKVVYEHTELRKALEAPNAMHNILSHIDEWEKKSIEKIKKKAGQARKDLLECIGRTKHELIGSLDTMGAEIKSSQEITTYAENEINQWMKKLEELRRIAEKPQNIEIVNDETPNSSINMITVIEKSNSRVFSTANQIAAQSRSLTTTLGACK